MGSDPSIAAGIDGTFEGGYRAVITSTLELAPPYRTRGNIGSFDYNWTGDPVVGPLTPFNWVESYFQPGASFSFEWWGWVYHGGPNGTWVNACDPSDGPERPGSGGDIGD